LLCDAAKGLLPVAIAWHFGAAAATTAAVAAIVGHIFPVWLRFRGGKGVATAAGALLGYSWPLAAVAIATWLFVAFVFRYSSLAAVAAAIAVPIGAVLLPRPGVAPWAILGIALLVLFRHRTNVMRLARGEEDRIVLHKPGA